MSSPRSVRAHDLQPGWRVVLSTSHNIDGIVHGVHVPDPTDGAVEIVLATEGKRHPALRYVRVPADRPVKVVSRGPVDGTTAKGATNARMLATVVAPQYLDDLDPSDVVLDVTYGEAGGWWREYLPPCNFIGSDIKDHDDLSPLLPKLADPNRHYLLGGIDARTISSELPHLVGRVAVAFFDPEYVATGTVEKSSLEGFHSRFGLASGNTPGSLLGSLVVPVLAELHRMVRPGGFVGLKGMNYTSGGHLVRAMHHALDAAESLGWEPWDEIVHAGYPGPQPTRASKSGEFILPQRTRAGSSFLWMLRRGEAPAPSLFDLIVPSGTADTSRAAARYVAVRAGSVRHRLLATLAWLDPDGATAHDLANRYDQSPNQVAARILELRKGGFVTRATAPDGSPIVRTTTPSNVGTVWVITPAGLAELTRLGAPR